MEYLSSYFICKDRLTHHAHILERNGESYRLKDSKQKRPSKPRS
ncbi:MAG: ATP-binding protein [Bryobacteraceae bacterium]